MSGINYARALIWVEHVLNNHLFCMPLIQVSHLLSYLLRKLCKLQPLMGRKIEPEASDQSCAGSEKYAGRTTGAHGRIRKRRRECATVVELPSSSILSDLVAGKPDTRQWDKAAVSIDCEMVGISPRNVSAAARCSIVDYGGKVLFDEYIKPVAPVTNYRTAWSGIKPHHLRSAIPHHVAIEKISRLLEGRIVVGHELVHDFHVLGITPPDHVLRDTAKFKPLRTLAGLSVDSTPALRALSVRLLGRKIQDGPHCSVEDAQAAMDIYRIVEHGWEQQLLSGSHFLFHDQFWPCDVVPEN